VTAAEILDRLTARWPLEPVTDDDHPEAPAERYRYLDGGGEVGIIASVTRPFCRTCTRARLSAVGEVYTCLFGSSGTSLRAMLRDADVDDATLRDHLAGLWQVRTDRYSELRATDAVADSRRVEMPYIGG
jgi:GTP 3',8-cyclase